jgi:transposase-like protein
LKITPPDAVTPPAAARLERAIDALMPRIRITELLWEVNAQTALADLVAGYRDSAPKLAGWLEQNAPEGLAVFTLPEHHRKRLRTSNPIERSVQQELKRRMDLSRFGAAPLVA